MCVCLFVFACFVCLPSHSLDLASGCVFCIVHLPVVFMSVFQLLQSESSRKDTALKAQSTRTAKSTEALEDLGESLQEKDREVE